MIVALIITAVLLSIISGFSKAICDLSEEGKLKFYKKTFWLKEFSWVNKYKNNDPKQGAKFLGSTTIFVMFTDAWHLFGLIERISFAIAFILSGLLIASNIWFIFFALGCYILFATIFHIFYTYIFKK